MVGSEVQAATKKVSLKLSDGATYYGEVKNGKPHGKGTMKWGENKSYSGDWVKGKRSGQGKYVNFSKTPNAADGPDGYDTDSLIYVGEWSNDKQNGRGTLMNQGSIAPRDYYESISKGTFKNNVFVSGYLYRYSEANSKREFIHVDGTSKLSIDIDNNSFGESFLDYSNKYYFSNSYVQYEYMNAKGNKQKDVYNFSLDSENSPWAVLTVENKNLAENLTDEGEPGDEADQRRVFSVFEKLLEPHVKNFDKIYTELDKWKNS